MLALDVFIYLEFFLNAGVDFFECKAHFNAQAGTAVNAPLLAATASKPAESAPESAAKNITKLAENVFHVGELLETAKTAF